MIITRGDDSRPKSAINCPRVRPNTAGIPKNATNAVGISPILAVAGILLDLLWRLITGNFFHPSYVDVLAALLVGYYLGKRPRIIKSEKDKKSNWIRLS
ncbi:MAG: hypothetical protein ABSF09_04345 [Candidatus Bathyarchaeia archaeon]